MTLLKRFSASFSIPLIVLVLVLGAALSGCNNSSGGGTKPSGLSEQQKGVMGGTPPPGEMAKIDAERAKQAQTQAEQQSKEQAAAAAKGGK